MVYAQTSEIKSCQDEISKFELIIKDEKTFVNYYGCVLENKQLFGYIRIVHNSGIIEEGQLIDGISHGYWRIFVNGSKYYVIGKKFRNRFECYRLYVDNEVQEELQC